MITLDHRTLFFSGGLKMYISRNPAKSRPLSANVKRLMRLSRAAPKNGNVVREKRHFTAKDLACCGKQGDLFMEAASMGFSMEDFAPLFMTSQLAGVFDASFSSSAVMENENLANLLQIPVLLKSPQLIVETLYWIDDIISKSGEGENKSLVLTEAYKAEKLKLPQALAELPAEPNRKSAGTTEALGFSSITDWKGSCMTHLRDRCRLSPAGIL
jgi:hypothetical protein